MALKVLLIGTGFGKYAVYPAYRQLGCDVEMVSPRDDLALARVLAKGCDLVSIHSPPFMHLQHVEMAFNRGCHVLCDKPFGRNAAEAGQMLELAQRSGKLHFLNYEFRFDPQREKLKALLDDGVIGQAQHLSYTTYLCAGRKMAHGWLFEKDAGGGWIGAFASHFVDTLHWLFGEIAEVNCQTRIDAMTHRDRDKAQNLVYTATAEDAVTALFRLANGVTASLDTAFSAARDIPPKFTLLGSEGVIELLPNSDVLLTRQGQPTERHEIDVGENPMGVAMHRWLTRVCEAIQHQTQIQPDFETGLKAARVLDRMRG